MYTMLNVFKWIALSLILIGAINWGLVGLFNFDLVSYLFGEMTTMTRIFYSIVGISAIAYFIFALVDRCDDNSCYN